MNGQSLPTAAERKARIRLNAFSYLRSDWTARLMEIFGGAEEILKQKAAVLSAEGGLTAATAQKLLEEAASVNPDEELRLTEKAGGFILTQEDFEYPKELLDIKEPPFILYVRGALEAKGPKIAMIGARNITPYGKRCAEKFASEAAQCGCVIVSGLARGVDSVCHKAAVAAGRPTWAVVGTGIGRCYPPENVKLAQAILEGGGAIISELPFNKPPHAFHFPRRNRIIAGLASVTCVIEGRVKSGALITAKLALEQGKEVLAVPGPVDSEQSGGPNMLIKEGAAPLIETRDIIDSIPAEQAFGLNPDALKKEGESVSGAELAALSDAEKKILAFIGGGQKTLDAVAEETSLNVPETAALLFELEVKGILACNDGQYALNIFRK
jgi:DNA processing protein